MIPPDHYRPGRLGAVDLAVVHTSESDADRHQLARYFQTTTRRVSCHSIVDATGRIDVLPFTETAFAAPGANADGDQLEVCGWARWTRAEWLARPQLLQQVASWLADRAQARGLPLVHLDAAGLRADRRGATGHVDVTAAFRLSTHTDPGSGFPWDVVLDLAHGITTASTHPPAATTVPAVRPVRTTRATPAYPGHLLRWDARRHVPTVGTAVLVWQRRMVQRGWTLTRDGVYGERSAAVCEAFQRDKHLPVDGIVGPVTWRASWEAPIT